MNVLFLWGGVRAVTARSRKGSLGFSLLEALVAMAIVSIAMGTLYRTVGQSSKNAVAVEERVEASLVARSVLAKAIYAEDLMREPAGQVGRWHWRLGVQPDPAQLSDMVGRAAAVTLPAARVSVEVMRAQDEAIVLNWVTWKPYRTAP